MEPFQNVQKGPFSVRGEQKGLPGIEINTCHVKVRAYDSGKTEEIMSSIETQLCVSELRMPLPSLLQAGVLSMLEEEMSHRKTCRSKPK